MRRSTLVVLFIVAIVVAGFAGALISGNLTKSSSGPTTTTTTKRPPSTTTSTLAHATVKVVVANGTQVNGAAAHFTQVLQAQGWSTSTPTNALTPSATTVVYYTPTMQASAAVIASELGVSSSAVQPMPATAPVTNITGLDIVVVVGSDLAGRTGTTTTGVA
jgi:hypothetical protein